MNMDAKEATIEEDTDKINWWGTKDSESGKNGSKPSDISPTVQPSVTVRSKWIDTGLPSGTIWDPQVHETPRVTDDASARSMAGSSLFDTPRQRRKAAKLKMERLQETDRARRIKQAGVRKPLDIRYEEHPLNETAKIALENRGFYGWWQTFSSSPSPGPTTFGTPQRRLTKRRHRLQELEVDAMKRHDPADFVLNHDDMVKVIRGEEKLKGHRCFCQFPYCSELGTSVFAQGSPQLTWDQRQELLISLQTPIVLLGALFQQALKDSNNEQLALMTDVKLLCSRSRLATSIFGLRIKVPTDAHHLDPYVQNLGLANPFAQSKASVTSRSWILEQWYSSFTACGNTIAEFCHWLVRAPLPQDFNPSGQSLAVEGSKTDSRASNRGQSSVDSDTPSPWKDFKACVQAWSKGVRQLYKDFFGSPNIWIPPEAELTSDAKRKLAEIMKDLNSLERRLIARSMAVSGPVYVTFSEFCNTLLVHLHEGILTNETRQILKREVPFSLMETLRIQMARRNEAVARYARDDLLGLQMTRVEGKVSDTCDMPEPLPMTIEPPNCAVEEIMQPLRAQVNRRLQQMREMIGQQATTKMDENGIMTTMSSDTNSIDDNESTESKLYQDWWKLDENSKEELRQHAAEIAGEIHHLHKVITEQQGVNKFDIPTLFDTKERVPMEKFEPAYLGPLEYEPHCLDQTLYGTSPVTIEDLIPHAKQMAMAMKQNEAKLRPFRVLGQSRQDLFLRDDTMKEDWATKHLLRDYSRQDLLRGIPAVPSWTADELLRQLTLNQDSLLLTADSGVGDQAANVFEESPMEASLSEHTGTSLEI